MENRLLTKREQEIFDLLALNKTTKEIAKELKISEKTVRNHISNTMQKLGVKGRCNAIIELLKYNFIKLFSKTSLNCCLCFFYQLLLLQYHQPINMRRM